MNVYFVRAGNRGAIKIGMADDVESRIAELQCGNPFKLNIISIIPCDSREQAFETERRIHKFFARQCIRGEWFQGNIDFRKLNDQMIDTDETKSSLNRVVPDYQPKKRKKSKCG